MGESEARAHSRALVLALLLQPLRAVDLVTELGHMMMSSHIKTALEGQALRSTLGLDHDFPQLYGNPLNWMEDGTMDRTSWSETSNL